MGSLNDSMYAALADAGYTGSLSDMLYAFKSEHGFTNTKVWSDFLSERGYTGSINDRELAFFSDSGPANYTDTLAYVGNLTFDTGVQQQAIEKEALTQLIYEQAINGNMSLLYEAHFFTFTNTSNALVGIKQATAAANVGSPTHSATGVTLSSTSSIDLGYAPGDLGATNRGYSMGFYAASYTPHATATEVFMGGSNASFGVRSLIQYFGDDVTDFGTGVNVGGFIVGTPAEGGYSNTIVKEVISISGTTGPNSDSMSFRRGNRIDLGTSATAEFDDACTSHIYVGGINTAGTVTLRPGTPWRVGMAYTALAGFNFAAWRKSVLKFLRTTGADTSAGRVRGVFFGDSNSDPTQPYGPYWHSFMNASSVLDTTYCVSGTGLGTNNGGTTTNTIQDRITAFCAGTTFQNANAIVVMGGTNDCLYVRNGGLTSAATIAVGKTAIDDIITAATTRGLVVYFVEIPPFSRTYDSGIWAGWQYYDAPPNEVRDELNAYMLAKANAANSSVRFLDCNAIKGPSVLGYEGLVEAYKANGTDPVHLNPAGHAALAASIIEQIQSDGSLIE